MTQKLIWTVPAAVAFSAALIFLSPALASAGLDQKCQALYERFIDWSSYYKAFAYGMIGNRTACAFREGKQEAIDACTANLALRGYKCRAYAVSPTKSGVQIVWNNVQMVQWTGEPNPALARLNDLTICNMATLRGAQGLQWDRGSSWNVNEAKRRKLSLSDCRAVLGPTKWRVEAVTASVEQTKRSVETPPVVEARQKIPQALRKKHRDAIAVIIGNKNYGGDIPEVSYAHNDAAAMKRFVLERLGYRAGNIIDLRDASQAEMMAVFGNDKTHEGRLFNWVKPGKSDVLVFYSGHGVPGMKDRRPYLLPVDADANQAEITGLPIDTIYANLGKTPARSITVYLDTCFSGESARGMIIRATSGISVAAKMPVTKLDMTVITASQSDQYASWDEKAKLGLFTKHLLEALQGRADGRDFGNSDGKVTLAEVQKYLDDEMSYQARRTWGRRQQAYVRGSNKTVLATISD